MLAILDVQDVGDVHGNKTNTAAFIVTADHELYTDKGCTAEGRELARRITAILIARQGAERAQYCKDYIIDWMVAPADKPERLRLVITTDGSPELIEASDLLIKLTGTPWEPVELNMSISAIGLGEVVSNRPITALDLAAIRALPNVIRAGCDTKGWFKEHYLWFSILPGPSTPCDEIGRILGKI